MCVHVIGNLSTLFLVCVSEPTETICQWRLFRFTYCNRILDAWHLKALSPPYSLSFFPFLTTCSYVMNHTINMRNIRRVMFFISPFLSFFLYSCFPFLSRPPSLSTSVYLLRILSYSVCPLTPSSRLFSSVWITGSIFFLASPQL